MWYLIVAGISCVIGSIVTQIILRRRMSEVGTLRVDTSDQDGPYFFLEISTSPYDIMNKRYITLEVKVENFVSHN